MDPGAGGLGGGLDRPQHRLGEGLLEEGQPADPQDQYVLLAQAEFGAQRGADVRAVGLGGEPPEIDAEGDERKLWHGPALAAEPGAQVIAPFLEHGGQSALHGR